MFNDWWLNGWVSYGAGLICAAVLLHGLSGLSDAFYYNKMMGTPPGALLTAGLTTWLWVIVYGLVDRGRDARWSTWVQPAGRHALFIFIFGPILYHLLWWSPNLTGGFGIHSWLSSPPYLGVARAISFVALVVWGSLSGCRPKVCGCACRSYTLLQAYTLQKSDSSDT